MLQVVKRVLVKGAVFSLRKMLLALTWLRRYPESDPTLILLDYETTVQKQAYANLATKSPPQKLKTAVIIPFRDKWNLTKVCVEGLLQQVMPFIDLDLILVDNGSVEPATKNGLENLQTATLPSNISLFIMRDDQSFNFSRLVNRAVRVYCDKTCDIIVLLNNDIEFTSTSSIENLARFAMDVKECGAVGATLVYPSEKIQHLFVAPGVIVMGAHPFSGLPWQPELAWFKSPRPVAAVTGACFAIKHATFVEAGGLDEKLPHSGQDVDLCLTLQRMGLTNWTLSQEKLIHHESASREKKLARSDTEYLYAKWGSYLTRNPFYSRALSRWSERPVLTFGEGQFPWKTYCS